jgi:hypothetical protein
MPFYKEYSINQGPFKKVLKRTLIKEGEEVFLYAEHLPEGGYVYNAGYFAALPDSKGEIRLYQCAPAIGNNVFRSLIETKEIEEVDYRQAIGSSVLLDLLFIDTAIVREE